MEYDAFSSTSTQPLIQCQICGRNFNPDALQRHEPICAKSNVKKRKTFDSSKQRVEGTELKQFNKSTKTRQPPVQQLPGKKSDWRRKHEEFIAAIRNAKGVQKAIEKGEPLPPPPPPTINPDYVQCPYCQRRFNETAAQRHIPFCKEQHERLPNRTKVSPQALQRAQARQYRATRANKKNVSSPPGSGTSVGTGGGYGQTPNGRTPNNQAMPRYSGGNRMNNRTDNDSYYSSMSGRALRTGRNTETYSEARELSAKQRQSMPSKSPQHSDNDDCPRYGSHINTNTGPVHGAPIRNGDLGYYSGDSDTQRSAKTMARMGSGAARFCHECGTKYPVETAKFCCECGVRRININ